MNRRKVILGIAAIAASSTLPIPSVAAATDMVNARELQAQILLLLKELSAAIDRALTRFVKEHPECRELDGRERS